MDIHLNIEGISFSTLVTLRSLCCFQMSLKYKITEEGKADGEKIIQTINPFLSRIYNTIIHCKAIDLVDRNRNSLFIY